MTYIIIIMLIVIILLIIILLYLIYINTYQTTEGFDNFYLWNNNITDNLDNLESINKPVNYNLTRNPYYNTKEYNALVWQLRFPTMVNQRYAYDDVIHTNKINNNDDNNWDYGNNDDNCHANNCDNDNCHGSNCYEKRYAILKDLPICQDNRNCPVDKLP